MLQLLTGRAFVRPHDARVNVSILAVTIQQLVAVLTYENRFDRRCRRRVRSPRVVRHT